MVTIKLTDDVRYEEPAGYLVFCPASCATCEYRVFADERPAKDAAHDHLAGDGAGDWPVYPLYAADPGAIPHNETRRKAR